MKTFKTLISKTIKVFEYPENFKNSQSLQHKRCAFR